jgi:hypothetical protein
MLRTKPEVDSNAEEAPHLNSLISALKQKTEALLRFGADEGTRTPTPLGTRS